jgi:hypothetical protein
LGKLTGAGIAPLLRQKRAAGTTTEEEVQQQINKDQQDRNRRQIPNCPPPRVGAPGMPGDVGEDGETGESGVDGPAGLDAITLLLQEAQKCLICEFSFLLFKWETILYCWGLGHIWQWNWKSFK